MLEQLVGLRLESVRLSKMSWVLEFQGYGPQPPQYVLSSGASVSCVSAKPGSQPIYDFIHEILEDDLVEARYSEKDRVVALRFRAGARLEFSNSNHEGGDNSAIITDRATGQWELLS